MTNVCSMGIKKKLEILFKNMDFFISKLHKLQAVKMSYVTMVFDGSIQGNAGSSLEFFNLL